jgi:hypothetical protein
MFYTYEKSPMKKNSNPPDLRITINARFASPFQEEFGIDILKNTLSVFKSFMENRHKGNKITITPPFPSDI